MRSWAWVVVVAGVTSACVEPVGDVGSEGAGRPFRGERLPPPETAPAADGGTGVEPEPEPEDGAAWADPVPRDPVEALRAYVAECDRALGFDSTPAHPGVWTLVSDAEAAERIDAVLVPPPAYVDPGPVEPFGFTEPAACELSDWPAGFQSAAAPVPQDLSTSAPGVLRIERSRYTSYGEGERTEYDVVTCITPAELVVGRREEALRGGERTSTSWRLHLGEDGRPAHYDVAQNGHASALEHSPTFEYDAKGRVLYGPSLRSDGTTRRAYDDVRGLRLESTRSDFEEGAQTRSSDWVLSHAGVVAHRSGESSKMGETRETNWYDRDATGRLIGRRGLYELLRGGMGPSSSSTAIVIVNDHHDEEVLRWEYTRHSTGGGYRRAVRTTRHCATGFVLRADTLEEPLASPAPAGTQRQ